MPTAAFLAAWNSSSRSAAVLVQVVLTSADGLSTKTLRLSTRDIDTPDGYRWAGAIIDPGVVNAPGSRLATDPSLATQSLTLNGRTLLSGASAAFDLMSGWVWVGASATTYLWETSLTTITDAQQVFAGAVLSADIVEQTLHLSLRQRVDWNRPVTPKTVTREEYPFADEATIGATVPIWLGAMPQPGLRAPFADPYTNATANQTLTDIHSCAAAMVFGGERVGRAVLVDGGRAAGSAKVLLASHELKAMDGAGYGIFMEDEDSGALALLRPATTFNTADGAGFYLDDDVACAYYPMFPTGVCNTFNSGYAAPDNPLGVMERWSENKPTIFDIDRAKNQLRLRFTNPGDPGNLLAGGATSATAYLVMAVDSTNGSLTWHSYQTHQVGETSLGSDSVTPNVPVWWAWPLTHSTLTSWSALTNITLTLGNWGTEGIDTQTVFSTGITRVYAVGVVIAYAPRQTVKEPARNTYVTERPERQQAMPGPYTLRWRKSSPVTQVEGKFFANVQGQPDDALGTYTGTANALIERPCDLVRYLLSVYGGETLAKFDLAFTDGTARALLRTWRQTDMVLGLNIPDQTDVLAAVAWVAESSASWYHLSPHDDKWRCVVWGGEPPVATRTIYGPFVELPRVGLGAASAVSSSVKVVYGYDQQDRGSSRHEVTLAPDKSSAGRDYFDANDQSLAIIENASDKLDITSGAGSTGVAYVDGSNILTSARGTFVSDNWAVGMTVISDLPGIQPGTTVTNVAANELTISLPVTESSLGQPFAGGVEYDTGHDTVRLTYGSFITSGFLAGDALLGTTAGHFVGKTIDPGGVTAAMLNINSAPAATVGYVTTPNPLNWSAGTNVISGTSGNFTSFAVGMYVNADKAGIPAGAKVYAKTSTTLTLTMKTTAAATSARLCGSTAAVYVERGGATLTQVRVVTLMQGNVQMTMTGIMDRLHDTLREPVLLGAKWAFAFGGHPRWRSHMVDFSIGATSYPCALALGTDDTLTHTMEEVAAITAAAMNGAGVFTPQFSCSYSRATKKFTISRAGAFTLKFGTGTYAASDDTYGHTAAASLGMTPANHVALPVGGGVYAVTSDYAIEEGRLLVTCSIPFSILFRTGPNGWLQRDPMLTAHSALGLSPYDDTPLLPYAYGMVAKGVMQQAHTLAVSRHIASSASGPARRETTIEARGVYDTDTALELRNRTAQLTCRPPIPVRVQAENLIGIERGEVVEFDVAMDALRPYPDPDEDGSWVGKALVVVETEQHLGPDSYFTEVVLDNLPRRL